jgi:hypothetical protein
VEILGWQECCICTVIVGTDEGTKRKADKLMQARALDVSELFRLTQHPSVTESSSHSPLETARLSK